MVGGLYSGLADIQRHSGATSWSLSPQVNCIIVVDRPQEGRYWVRPSMDATQQQQYGRSENQLRLYPFFREHGFARYTLRSWLR